MCFRWVTWCRLLMKLLPLKIRLTTSCGTNSLSCTHFIKNKLYFLSHFYLLYSLCSMFNDLTLWWFNLSSDFFLISWMSGLIFVCAFLSHYCGLWCLFTSVLVVDVYKLLCHEGSTGGWCAYHKWCLMQSLWKYCSVTFAPPWKEHRRIRCMLNSGGLNVVFMAARLLLHLLFISRTVAMATLSKGQWNLYWQLRMNLIKENTLNMFWFDFLQLKGISSIFKFIFSA